MKNLNKFYPILLISPLILFFLVANSSGPPAGNTGSPGDGGTTCTQCHDNTGNFGASVSITTNIPEVEGFTPGATYLVNIVQNSSASLYGFQITAENVSGSRKGTFTSIDANTRTISNDEYAEHTSAGNQFKSWQVNWTAPLNNPEPIVFYVASNAANGNGNNTGDQIVTNQSASFGVLPVEDFTMLEFNLYPNPSDEEIRIDLPEISNNVNYEIYDYTGRVLIKQNLLSFDNNINISNLKAGMYLIRLENNKKIGVKSFLKE